MNAVGQNKSAKLLEKPENMEMPKSENSTIAVNQQGSSLAYIVGVYFGDGYISKHYWNGKVLHTKGFRLKVIDEDFRDYTAKCCEVAFPERKTTRFIENAEKRTYYGLQVATYGTYLESITGKRKFVPNFIYESKEQMRAFVEGLLDSEGWVQLNISKAETSINCVVSFAITSEVVHELKRILDKLDVKTGKIATYTKNRKKALKQLNINTKSFIESGLRFHCGRKQVRVDAFEMILQTRSITQEISRKIFKGAFREQRVDSFKEMVCSDLCGDIQRLAEMTNPARKGE